MPVLEPAAVPWRILAAVLVLGCMGLALFGDLPDRPVDPGGTDSLLVSPPDTITVRVLNGSGCAGLARQVQRFLESQNGSTVFVAPGNPEDADRDDYEETVVVSHVPGTAAAATVASVLRLDRESIAWEVRQPPEVDVTVYLGRDVGEMRDSLLLYVSN